jgi:c-di-GMP-binding flagellar brake protein YcgR
VDTEKRQHLRLETEIACTVRLPTGDAMSAKILNLSVGGLMFSCGRDTFHQLLPKDQRTPGQVTGVVIEIRFELQPPSQPLLSIDANARVIHSERLAQDVFHVGVQFINIDEATAQTLAASIHANHAPRQA